MRGKSGTFNFLQMAAIDVTPTRRRSSRLRRRVATLLVLSTTALCALALADSAWASGSNPSSDPLPGSADTTATAAQAPAQPTPATTQDPAAAAQAALDAATQQAATAVATANQNAQNIVVIIRINSPGDDVINQSNTAIANAVAANTSSTNQGSGGGSADNDRGQPDGTTPDTSAASSTPPTAMPAQAEPAPAASSAATPPVTAAAPAHRLATQGSERARPRAFAAAQRPSSGPPSSGHRHHAASAAVAAAHAPAAPAAPAAQEADAEPVQQVAPREAASAVPRSTSAPRVGERRSSLILAPARAHRAAARAGAGAAHILGSFGRLPGLSGDAADKADPVSTVVVLTLLAVLVAIFLGVGSTYVPAVRAWAGR